MAEDLADASKDTEVPLGATYPATAQNEALRRYYMSLLQNPTKGVGTNWHWTMGLNDMVRALMGGKGLYGIGQKEKGAALAQDTNTANIAGRITPFTAPVGTLPTNPTQPVGSALPGPQTSEVEDEEAAPDVKSQAAAPSAAPAAATKEQADLIRPALQTADKALGTASPVQNAKALKSAPQAPPHAPLPNPAPGNEPIIDPRLVNPDFNMTRTQAINALLGSRSPAERELWLKAILGRGQVQEIDMPGIGKVRVRGNNPAVQQLIPNVTNPMVELKPGLKVPIQMVPQILHGQVAPPKAMLPEGMDLGGGAPPPEPPPQLMNAAPAAMSQPNGPQNAAPAAGPLPQGGPAAAQEEPQAQPQDAAPTMLGVKPPLNIDKIGVEPQQAAQPATQVAQAQPQQGGLQGLVDWSRQETAKDEAAKTLATKGAESYNTHYDTLYNNAHIARNTLGTLGLLKTIVEDPGMVSGAAVPLRVATRNALNTLGFANQNPTLNQIFEKFKSANILKDISQMGGQHLGQIRLAQILFVALSNVDASNTPGSNLAIIDQAERVSKQMINMFQVAKGYDQGYRLNDNGQWVRGNTPKDSRGLQSALDHYEQLKPLNPEINSKEAAEAYIKQFVDKGAPPPTSATNHPGFLPPRKQFVPPAGMTLPPE